MNPHLVDENPVHIRRDQWNMLMDAIHTVDVLTVSFRDQPQALAIILDQLQGIGDCNRRYKQSLPIGYRRKRDI